MSNKVKEILDFFMSHDYFLEFNKSELKVLTDYTELKRYKKGDVIFNEGDVGNELYILKEGTVNICRKSLLGDLIIAQIRKGEIFGEMSIIEDLPRSATAKVENDCEILCLKKLDFIKLKKEYPKVAIKLMDIILRLLSRRLREIISRTL